MKAPDKIYIDSVFLQYDNIEVAHTPIVDDTEYIRADLAELTIYDIDKIHGLLLEGLNYEEVLRRFLEIKRK